MAEGDGAWVVLGRKIDRFQSPSGHPERPQGVPEAGRGVILSFVFVFLKMERELLVVSTNATIPNENLDFRSSWKQFRCDFEAIE